MSYLPSRSGLQIVLARRCGNPDFAVSVIADAWAAGAIDSGAAMPTAKLMTATRKQVQPW